MDLRGDTLTSNNNSEQGSRSQRRNKGQTKPSKHATSGELKLSRFGSQSKLDKRSSGRDYDKDEQIERVFRLHARTHINEDQAIFSLKLLGYSCQSAEEYIRFNKIWGKYGEESINEESFRLLAEEVRAKGEMRDNRLTFEVLTQGAGVLDRTRLQAIGRQLGLNTDGLIEVCGMDKVIDFSQFDSILKFTNALK